MQRLCKDQIEDFVRKLGFLDAKTKEGEMVKKFLRLNEVKVHVLYFPYGVCMVFNPLTHRLPTHY